MPQDVFDPYHKWLGIAPHEQPPTLYRLLGISTLENDPDVIDRAADGRLAVLKTVQVGQYAAFSQRLMMEISSARVRLLDPDAKAHYDAELRSSMTPSAPRAEEVLSQILPEKSANPRSAASAARSRAKRSIGISIIATVIGGGIVGLSLGYWIIVSVLKIDLLGTSSLAEVADRGTAPNVPHAKQSQVAPPGKLSQSSSAQPKVVVKTFNGTRPLTYPGFDAPSGSASPNVGPRPFPPSPGIPQPTPVSQPQPNMSGTVPGATSGTKTSPVPELSLAPSTPESSLPTPSLPAGVEIGPAKYDRFGKRLTTSNTTPDEEIRTVKSWLDFAVSAQSPDNKRRASEAILSIVKFHDAGVQKLADEEQQQIREASLKLLAKKEGDPVRILETLASVVDDSCRRPILLTIKNSQPATRRAALEALKKVADNSCIDELAEIVRRDTDQQNKIKAVELLGTIATPAAKAELKRLSKGNNTPKVNDAILSAIDKSSK